MNLRIAAAVVVITLVWGTTWAAIRVGLAGVPPFTGAALRFALAGSVLLVAARMLGVRLGASRREVRLWIVNALGSFLISYGVVYWAEQYVPSGLAAVLFSTFPLFVAILAHFFLTGERLTRASTTGVLVGFSGVAVIFSEDLSALDDPWATGGTGPSVAVAAAILLIAPAVASVANVMVKKWGRGVHPISLSAIPMLGASLGLGAVAFVTERHEPMTFDAASVGSILYLALFGSALNFSLYFWVLERVPAARLALFNYAVPVVAVATGALFLHEPVTGRLLAGAALVIVGCSVALLRRRRSP